MRGLLRFIYKYRAFELFIFLQAISIWLLVRNNRYYNAAYLSSSNSVVATLNQNVFNTNKYFSLREVNEQLAKENALLREQLTKYMYESEYENLSFNDSLINRYEIIPAKVERNSTAKKNNLILLDKGKLHDIKPGMGVIGTSGVVGQIRYVSDNFSTAVSLLHTDIRISSMLTRDNTIGTTQWDGDDIRSAKLKYVPRHVPLAIGDTVVTSGFNSVFPPGVMIGRVKNVDVRVNESFYDIDLALSTEFSNLSMTYIIKDKLIMEIDSLMTISE
ncbi:MAG: rod shape-determining protein MreC [Cyclobacteriaceae bacterium]